MSKQIIIAEQHRIAAVFSEDQIQELVVATGQHQVSDIYLGIVENVLPGIDAAFVNIGDTERNGFIHVSDLGPVKLKKTAGAITELLAPQQKVLVQIMKEPTGNKGPRLTGNISLPGRYLVLMPSGKGVNLSRRIRDEDERNRLRALGILIKPAGMGLLVRTEAEDVSEEAIIDDLDQLQKQWESVQQQALSTRAPALLNRDDDFIQRVLRDVYSTDVNRIVVDSATGLKRVKQHLTSWSGNRLPQGVLVDQHREGSSVLEYFRVNAAIREALKPRVDLPSGGYIVIERTEALTVVDVNSGSFTRSATARETVLWTNCEAATEIARQLRLRNIAGVIIIDFIDMDARRDQLQVLEHFNKALKADKARPQIAQLTELGLVELTRKRMGQNIYELFSKPCHTCGGLGHLAHLPGEAPDAAGEMVERVPVLRSYESTPSGLRLPDVGVHTPELSLDPSDDLQELDLTNHPNYQDKGSRRRRRGRRLGETLPRESVPPGKVLRQSPSSLSGIPSASSIPNGLAIDANGLSKKLPDKAPPERVKPSRFDTIKVREDKPPEVIAVNMSPQEQDVFAFMGISPLILFEGEVKNPRTAVIEIYPPGHVSNSNGSAPSEEESLDFDAFAGVEDRPSATDPRDTSPILKVSTGETETEAPESAAQSFVERSIRQFAPNIVTSAPVEKRAIAAEETQDELDGAPRRRRRRSSAESGKAEQLSFGTES
ncbi:Rne/Rng family ribonuclease [Altericista sp. CCNU0014]|uniref:Rne/Rng family ribonuclease n=1 Tax=Altericista sp. CCNU0014 TaxID=3082949 RepID=UPI00384A6E42